MAASTNTRREFIKAVGAGAAALAAPGVLPVAAVERRSKCPNILVIHVDQHRMDCLGAYGNREIQTPHIDALAADGVRYDNSFCPFPVCTPSRYSLLSGLYVHEHAGSSNRCTLAPGIETFPRLLRDDGWRTAAVGKMHFTPTYLDVGFERLFLSEQDGDGRWDDDYHRHLMRLGLADCHDLEDQRGEYRKDAPKEYWETCGALVSDVPEAHHSTTWIGERALEEMEPWNSQGGSLLMAGFIKPHHPFDPPAPWHQRYDPAKLTLLPGWQERPDARDLALNRGYFPHEGLTEAKLRRAMAYYYATISHIDHQVGRMVALLRRKGLYEDTLIVYTSDHGDYMGFHHLLLKGNHMYDPLVKVPLIVKWPGSARAGTSSSRMVSNVDLAPTLLRAAGSRPAPAMHGQDLAAEGAGHDIIFAESGGRHVMARTRTRKLIHTAVDQPGLLFDLEKDPLEKENRYTDPAYRDDVARLNAALDAWRPNGPVRPHLDLDAPQIAQPNVPPRDLSHREAIIAYYHRKARER